MGETQNAQRAGGYRRNRLGNTRALLMNTGLDTGNLNRLISLNTEPVGAGLLAKGPYQSTSLLNDTPRSSERRPEQARFHLDSA